MADALLQMCLVRGRAFLMANGARGLRYVRRAIELDNDNGKAHIILGASKIYPPVFWGGNPEKGIDLMKQAASKPDIEKDDLFNIYSGIGIAYGKLGRNADAEYWFAEALAIYPRNSYALRQYALIR